jgi:hypothetical protein
MEAAAGGSTMKLTWKRYGKRWQWDAEYWIGIYRVEARFRERFPECADNPGSPVWASLSVSGPNGMRTAATGIERKSYQLARGWCERQASEIIAKLRRGEKG